jgi:tRNA-dihydrouridine synthase B
LVINESTESSGNIQLGPLKLDTDLLIAPLMDVTTPSFIMLCKHYGGVGQYTMPMVFINQIVAAPKTVRPYAEFVESNRPSSLQIVGSGKSIEDIERAIDILNSYNFDMIDINCGCPARHTCNSGGGASLMKSHRYKDLQTIIRTTIKTSNKPVSVKIRIGWDSEDGLKETVKMIEDEGASFITVHGRLAKQGYSGIVNLDAIKLVKMQ